MSSQILTTSSTNVSIEMPLIYSKSNIKYKPVGFVKLYYNRQLNILNDVRKIAFYTIEFFIYFANVFYHPTRP